MTAKKICIEEEFNGRGPTNLYFVMCSDGEEIWGLSLSQAREAALSFKEKYEGLGHLVTVLEFGKEVL